MKVRSIWKTEWKALRDGQWWNFKPNEEYTVNESFRDAFPTMLIEIFEEPIVKKESRMKIIDTDFKEIDTDRKYTRKTDIIKREIAKIDTEKKKAGRPKGSKNKKKVKRGRPAKRRKTLKPKS